MKKSIALTTLLAAATLIPLTAQAEMRVRAGVGSYTYSLGGDYTSGESQYKPATFGLTFAGDDGFYVDMAVTNGSGTHSGWATANAPTTICGGSSCGNAASPNESFKRQDYSIIAGASSLNPETGTATTFYVGLKGGKTTLGAQNAGLPWTEETFSNIGAVFGGGWSFPFDGGNMGILGVNLGMGAMGATWEDNNGFSTKSSTAFGLSYGLSYTLPLTSDIGMTVDYKGNKYSFNFGDTVNAFKVDETFSGLGASVYFKF
jgi:hypothetical protein